MAMACSVFVKGDTQLNVKERAGERLLGRGTPTLRESTIGGQWSLVMNENSADPDYFQGSLWARNIRFIEIRKCLY